MASWIVQKVFRKYGLTLMQACFRDGQRGKVQIYGTVVGLRVKRVFCSLVPRASLEATYLRHRLRGNEAVLAIHP